MNDQADSARVTNGTHPVFSLPAFIPPARFGEYFAFAHEFDGEEIKDWDETRIAAQEIYKVWEKDGIFPDDLILLRGALVIQVRYARFIEGYPGELDMPYLDALVQKIKTLL